MQHWFDELARTMASGVSRRQAFGRLAALLGGAAFASITPTIALADDDHDRGPCADFCRGLPDDQLDRCNDQATHAKGACYDCGPKGNNKGLCGKACCANGGDCLNGHCVSCPTGKGLQCLQTCPSGQTLQCGTGCGATGALCPAGSSCCAGVCANTNSDAKHCGVCGNDCSQSAGGHACVNGACGCVSSTDCPTGEVCLAGACSAPSCGGVGQACCASGTPCPSGCCDPQTNKCVAGCGQSPSGTSALAATAVATLRRIVRRVRLVAAIKRARTSASQTSAASATAAVVAEAAAAVPASLVPALQLVGQTAAFALTAPPVRAATFASPPYWAAPAVV